MRAALSRPFAAPGRIDPRYAARVRRRAIADRARGAGRLCDARPDPVRTARCAARGLWVHTVQPAIASGVAGMAAADCADDDQRGWAGTVATRRVPTTAHHRTWHQFGRTDGCAGVARRRAPRRRASDPRAGDWATPSRTEERRVGKKGVRPCGSRWSPDH